MRVFLMWRLPTPWAPSSTRVFRWKAAAKNSGSEGEFRITQRGHTHRAVWRLPRKSQGLTDQILHCALPGTYLETASSSVQRWSSSLKKKGILYSRETPSQQRQRWLKQRLLIIYTTSCFTIHPYAYGFFSADISLQLKRFPIFLQKIHLMGDVIFFNVI